MSAFKKYYSELDIKNWLEGRSWPYIYHIMAALVYADAIPEGQYLVKADW